MGSIHPLRLLVHGSVCRDQLENRAPASGVHASIGLPAKKTLILDVSNACLGFLNGCPLLAKND
ncbi:MAG: hypothetical protein Ct9H300mP1_39550 [Planctomycetaceae bacterium]|nr:MAG: hypothetical protein Ct9H300mP1_39550 [Planctomycetaceae bacterium]